MVGARFARPIGSASGQPDGAPVPRIGLARLGTGLVVAIPAAAELAVGGYQLGGPSLWRDEAYTIEVAQRPVGRILALLGRDDAVHGPYYLLMHVVVGALGTSAVAVRLPSLLATSVAAGMLALLGRRLAVNSALPAPPVIGLLAGLLFVAAAQTTFYAQDARSYGLTTMFAVIASYLLLRASAANRWRWWACYAASIACVGLLSVLALLLVAAHAGTMLAARVQARATAPAAGRPSLARWLVAVTAAGLAVSPVAVLGYRQAEGLSWVTRPDLADVTRLLTDLAGSRTVLPLIGVLALAGLAGGAAAGRPGQPALTALTLPWLVLPPLTLLVVSRARPVYVERYVNFCGPALALLVAAGLGWLTRQVARLPVAASRPALAWLPAAAAAAALTVLFIAPQQAVRLPTAHPDNLRAVSATIEVNEQPGDAVFYYPSEARVISFAYPAPFQRLRDIALAQPVAASSSLTGAEVPAAVVRDRFVGVPRVWLVTWIGDLHVPPSAAIDQEERALVSGLRLAGRWYLHSVVLTLYVPRRLRAKVPSPPGPGRARRHAAGHGASPGPGAAATSRCRSAFP